MGSTAIRHGIIDVGSNAIRMRIVETKAGQSKRIHKERAPVRLGTSVFATGRISEELIAAAAMVFADFAATFKEFDVDRICAVATSATREAANHHALCQRIQAASNIELQVISGDVEADLLARAMATKLDFQKQPTLLLDLGAGSVEVVFVDGQRARGQSFKIGALRLLRETLPAGNPDHGTAYLQAMEHYVATFREKILAMIGPAAAQSIRHYAVCGGSLEQLQALMQKAGESTRSLGVQALDIERLQAWQRSLAEMTREERIETYTLRSDRADTIVPAAVVTTSIAKMIGVDTCLVPRVDLKDGLLQKILAEPEP